MQEGFSWYTALKIMVVAGLVGAAGCTTPSSTLELADYPAEDNTLEFKLVNVGPWQTVDEEGVCYCFPTFVGVDTNDKRTCKVTVAAKEGETGAVRLLTWEVIPDTTNNQTIENKQGVENSQLVEHYLGIEIRDAIAYCQITEAPQQMEECSASIGGATPGEPATGGDNQADMGIIYLLKYLPIIVSRNIYVGATGTDFIVHAVQGPYANDVSMTMYCLTGAAESSFTNEDDEFQFQPFHARSLLRLTPAIGNGRWRLIESATWDDKPPPGDQDTIDYIRAKAKDCFAALCDKKPPQ